MVRTGLTRDRPPLVCITGATASGKSSLALQIAEVLEAEILSVDSMQVYRGFDIGTAKPSREEQELIVHHGIDLVEPHESFSAGAFADYAHDVLATARAAGRTVLAVGGTGLYLKALLYGLSPSTPGDPVLRDQLRREEAAEPGSLLRRLRSVDPETAARLHPNDLVRVERALEVFLVTGTTQAQWVQQHGFGDAPYRPLVFGLQRPREELRARMEERIDTMMAAGWVDEVRALLAAGVTEEMTPMKALGYREICQYLRSEIDDQELRRRIAVVCHRFAKRQGTWFNREQSIEWLEPDRGLASQLALRIREFLDGVRDA